MRTYCWNCFLYDIDNTSPEICCVALGQSVNSNVAPVARVVGHPWNTVCTEKLRGEKRVTRRIRSWTVLELGSRVRSGHSIRSSSGYFLFCIARFSFATGWPPTARNTTKCLKSCFWINYELVRAREPNLWHLVKGTSSVINKIAFILKVKGKVVLLLQHSVIQMYGEVDLSVHS
jgi:hypothetical protein